MFRSVLLSLVLVGLCGCSIPSLHSIVSPEVVVDDPGLEGLWADDDGELVVRVGRADKGRFEVTVVSMPDDARKTAAPISLDATLVKLGETTFADLVLNKEERQQAAQKHHSMVVRTHQFIKVARIGDTLRIWSLDYEHVRDRLLDGTIPLAHARLDESEGGPDLVLTAPTDDLQAFLRSHADSPKVWTGPATLKRRK